MPRASLPCRAPALVACVVLGALLSTLLGAGGLVPSRPAAADGDPELRRSQVVRSVERAKPAVVSVRTTQVVTRQLVDWDLVIREEPTEVEGSLGSGVIFHPAGFVITNAHVILRGSNFFVHPPGQEQAQGWSALPLAIDVANDLAILRILPQEGRPATFPWLPLGRSNDLMLGESVIAVGNPFKLGLSVSTGVVAGVNRALKLGRTTFDDFIQVDAAINPGNSGGPLLDVTGRWIGVTTSIYRRVYGAEGIAFAIPADRVRRLVGVALKARAAVGAWLGLEEAEAADGGLVVKAVFPVGPAAASELREGDRIVAVDGTPTPTPYDYALALLDVAPGKEVEVRARRGTQDLPVQRIRFEPIPTSRLARERLGLEVDDVGDYEAGVLVRAVGGPAAKVGLQPGDVLVGLGTRRIRHTDDLLVFLQFVRPGDLVDVHVRRAGAGSRELRELTGSLKAD